MTTPDTPPTIVEQLGKVMEAVQAVGKTGRNTKQGYSFRGVDAVVNAVGPALRAHGVVIVPTTEVANYREVEVGQNRTLQRECTVKVRYRCYGPAGDHIEGTVYAEALDSGDKATAKAHSVAYRTFLLQALTVPTDEPDPDEHTVERAARQEQPRLLLPEHRVAEFVKACEEAGVDFEQVVEAATGGRTLNPAEVFVDEQPALREAKAAAVAALGQVALETTP